MELKIKNKKHIGYSARERRKFPFVYTLIAFPVIQVLIFYFYINFSAILMAFHDADGAWSLASFKGVIDSFVTGVDSRTNLNMWEMLAKGAIAWGVDNVYAFIINIFMAFILSKHMIFSKTFRLIYFIPGIVGGVIFSTIMKEMYAYNGPVTNFIKELGVELPVFAKRNGLLGADETAFATLMIQRSIFQITGGSVILAGAYIKIPEEIFESSKLEGCGFFREIFSIAIPCVWPTITSMFIFSICSILTYDYGAYLYSNGSGAHGITSISYYLYRYQVNISENPNNTHLYGHISAFGVLVTVITMVLVFTTRKIMDKLQEPVGF